jgi:hypothetical protein
MTSPSYDYPIHPLADVFPNLPAEEFKKLKQDIDKHGQLEPIMLSSDGTVLLDGRHRLRACKELGITPKIDRLEQASEADYIWSKNILRRHLTDDQRATIANDWYDAEKAAAKERQKHHGGTAPGKAKQNTSGESAQSVRARKAIAVKAQVSEHKVRQVETVTKQAPELLPKIKSGEMKLKDAAKGAAKKFRVRRKTKSVADRVAAHPEQIIDVPVEKKESQPETTTMLVPCTNDGVTLTEHSAWIAMRDAITSRIDSEEFEVSGSEIIAKDVIEKEPRSVVEFITLIVNFEREPRTITLQNNFVA